jgi:formylglycine-generating enzyme required for sulfatase activity
VLAQVSDGKGLTPLEGVLPITDDRALWDSVKDSRDVAELQAYLKKFPTGLFAEVATIRIRTLSGTGPVGNPQVSTQSPQVLQRQAIAPGQIIKDCVDCPEMVVIPAGSFTMGSSAAEQSLANAGGLAASLTGRENPQHRVNIRSFAAGRYAISKGEFAAFVRAKGYQTEAERGDGCVGKNGKEWKKDAAYNWRNVGFTQADNHPVVCVSWNDAQAYIGWLNQTSGQTYRLLSEAEREYATRGGTQTAFWWGDSINTAQANYIGTAPSYNGSPKGEHRQATVPVNSFSPNPFGLYNVHGNVWEWVEDCWCENYNGAPTDGSAWTTGDCRTRALRGGSWYGNPSYLRSALRNSNTPDYRSGSHGMRLARTLFSP